MNRSPLHQQVDTLPDLVRQMIDPLVRAVREGLAGQRPSRVFLTGCGDSHHAPLNAEMAFEQLAGLPCEPMTAMQFARYAADFLPPDGDNLVIGVSVSGQVSRAAEALALARQKGATAVALTGNPHGALAAEADLLLKTAVPPLPDELQGQVVPGARSYVASQLALYLCAVQLGENNGRLRRAEANRLRHELAGMAELMEETIVRSDGPARAAAEAWADADRFVICGAGPNYGTALFTAAKLIEASGDTAVAQDLEEWAHLQYFERQTATPTFLIGAGGRDEDRALEIATAAQAIGRRVAIIAPHNSRLANTAHKDALLATAAAPHECFSPLLTCLPGVLFAATRAGLLGEPYFRNFGGGRSVEGGGGISRIRTSSRIDGGKDREER